MRVRQREDGYVVDFLSRSMKLGLLPNVGNQCLQQLAVGAFSILVGNQ